MYSKQEETFLRKQFWTSLGQYLAPVPSAGGSKINWINYKTGIRFINFKMDVVKDHAYIGIEILHNNPAIQKLYFDHFKTLQMDIEKLLSEKWVWEENVHIDGKNISRIYQTMRHINIYKQTDWPQIITFLKVRIIALDTFWAGHKEIFEMLN